MRDDYRLNLLQGVLAVYATVPQMGAHRVGNRGQTRQAIVVVDDLCVRSEFFVGAHTGLAPRQRLRLLYVEVRMHQEIL